MTKKAVTRKLNKGVSIVIAILVFISISSYWSVSNQTNSLKNVTNSRNVISLMNQLLMDFKNIDQASKAFQLTNDMSFIEPLEDDLDSIPNELKKIRSYLISSSSIQNNRLDSIEKLLFVSLEGLLSLVKPFGKDRNNDVEFDIKELDKLLFESNALIKRLIDYESRELELRLKKLDSSVLINSIIIIFSGVVCTFVTIRFYYQVRKDILNRIVLQEELSHKDKIIAKRILATQEIAQKIAKGDYKAKILDDGTDDLGSLTLSLNEMASSLETAFNNIKDHEWLQTGIALLNNSLKGDKSAKEVAYSSLINLIEYSLSSNGAFYVFEEGCLKLLSTYGFETEMQNRFAVGEGIIGQAYLDQKVRVLDNVNYVTNCTNGSIRISSIIILPLCIDDKCIGIIELGAIKVYNELIKDFVDQGRQIIALEFESATSRMQIQSLLNKTQAQSEELQSQHYELENLNSILEAHTKQLQVSEEELIVQQEELLQINQELEDQSKRLEEKNEIVANRNFEIQKKVEELAITTKYKSDFMANMSHELRTPLNSILLLSRLLVENLKHNLTEDQVESARVIESSGISLLDLIDEILDLSRIEAGKLKLEYDIVSIDSVVNSLEGMFKPISFAKGLDFYVEVGNEVPEIIEIDKLRLEQVLRNFLSNAIKFTSNGFVKLIIRVDEIDKQVIHFVVEDTGIGIEPKNQQLIFEAFKQADGSTRRKYGGTGLGLSISKEIARLLGGEIQVISKLHKGSRFILSIPIYKTGKDDNFLVLEGGISKNVSSVKEINRKDNFLISVEIPDEIPDDRLNIGFKDKVILIIEDDITLAKVLLAHARKNGFKAIVVVRGDFALSAAEKYQPIAILLDIQLPVMDGWQIMEELKSNPNTSHIPIHVMSSFLDDDMKNLTGAIDFIKKPFDLDRIDPFFNKINYSLNESFRKILIIDDSAKHATALSYFLESNHIESIVKNNLNAGLEVLLSGESDCIILNMGPPDAIDYEDLKRVKNIEGLENLPIIIFTSQKSPIIENLKANNYIDSIVFKNAQSFQRVLDEVELFLHLLHENIGNKEVNVKSVGGMEDVLKDKTILIVDDDIRNIFTLTKILEQYKMNVVTAIDGREALVELEKNPNITIVLMDIMMPEMDGYECIEVIRKNSKYLNLPIIALTAKAMKGDREKCIEVGASDYISKPIDKNQLLSLLRVWLY